MPETARDTTAQPGGSQHSEGTPALTSSAPADASFSAHVRDSALHAVFGGSPARRAVLKLLGTSAALAAIGSVMPLGDLEAMAEEKLPLEKPELTVGFITISCCTPLIVADKLDLFKKAGLDVELVRTPGWGIVRERVQSGQYEAAQMLAPMPLAMSLGVGGPAHPTALALMQNVNGNSLVLAMKHKDRRDPKSWKGFTFGVAAPYSIHNLLLRYYLAEQGLDPDKDVTIKVVAAPEMPANLNAGILDGFLAPDNLAQMTVHNGFGFIHMLSRDIWAGHPCCGFGASEAFIEKAPNTYLALMRAFAEANAHVSKPENRKEAAAIIAQPKYLNAPVEVMEAVLIGKFQDGLGNERTVPDRIGFEPFPYPSMAVWMLTQMKRWKLIGGDVNYKQIADKVFRAAGAQKLLAEAGLPDPGGALCQAHHRRKDLRPRWGGRLSQLLCHQGQLTAA